MKTSIILSLLVICVAIHSTSSALVVNNHRRRSNQNKIESVKTQKSTKDVDAAKSQYESNHKGPMKILRNDVEMKSDGAYNYLYQTSNGIMGMEEGVGGVAVNGNSSYTSPEGIEIKMTYTADENGYHPVGDHIPKMPDYIVRALEYIRTHQFQERKINKQKPSRKFPNDEFIESVTPFKLLTEIAPPTLRPTVPPPPLRRFSSPPTRKQSFAFNRKLSKNNKNDKKRKF